MKKILFVCHGNICRSVMAEMVMRYLVAEADREDEFMIDSCATSREEIGNDIYPPAKRCLTAHQVPSSRHAARQITKEDYDKFDLIAPVSKSCAEKFKQKFGNDYPFEVVRNPLPVSMRQTSSTRAFCL